MMKLVAYDKEKLNLGMYKKTKNLKILNEFINSDMDCARVEGYSNVNAASCASSLKRSVDRFRMTGIEVFVRKGEVYLVKKTN